MTYQEENRILINKIKKYIHENIQQKLPLDLLAKKENYSPFHFQRIFKSIVGETPKQYLKRIRLENVIHYIYLKPSVTIQEVAFNFGFTSIESFSRAFKNYYNISPDGFRKSTETNKLTIIQNKTDKAFDLNLYINKSNSEDLEVDIVSLAKRKFYYLSNTLSSPETVTNGFKNIVKWGETRELISPSTDIFALLLDYPLYTSLDRCRLFTCISVEAEIVESGEKTYLEIPPRRYASFKAKGGLGSLIREMTKLKNNWLPESGYEVVHSPTILKPLDNPTLIHQHDLAYQVYIAVKPK